MESPTDAKAQESTIAITEEEVQRLENGRLKLADHKTEAVLFTSRKQVENITLDVRQCTITFQLYIIYLGVMLDTRLSFKLHVEHVAVKAVKVATSLARLMPNISGPRQLRRKLLASIVISILTYGIAIWGEALKIKECRRKIVAVNRLSALRVSCAFRTVSDEAVCVIAGMMPIEVLAVERKQLYEQQSSIPEEQKKNKKNTRGRIASKDGRRNGMHLKKGDGHITSFFRLMPG